MLAMDPKEALKQRATELGFDLVSVAPVKPGRDLEFAREWIERGYGGEMDYLANPKRFNPRAVLPSIKSVICVGLIYHTPFPYSTEVGSRQKAVGRDRESEVGSQESRVKTQKAERTEHQAEGRRQADNSEAPPATPQPSPPGRGWPAAGGPGEGEMPRAWISRYAWGRDYHEIMREKLERLRAGIEEMAPGIETRVNVDTGPVIERAFARFSGLGWMGKNTCLINEEKGSWFFLGVILTNLELEPDLPAPDRCGCCRACLDACPTGALVEPYVMDASRCISYLTIELKGSIPREFRPDVGVNIFGCDICQDVCPWNGKSRLQVTGVRCQESSFQPLAASCQPSAVSMPKLETGNWKLETGNPRLGAEPEIPLGASDGQRTTDNGRRSQPSAVSSPHLDNPHSSIFNHQSSAPDTRHAAPDTFSLFNPPLEVLAALTEEDFRRIFAHSPVKRAKYRGWLRNLCVAMGNSGDARFVPKLQELSQHPDPIAREHAQWALSQLAGPELWG